jgi:hypothetical protein
MTSETPDPRNPVLFAAVFNQNWENVRHVKNERISFMNAYSLMRRGTHAAPEHAHEAT